MKQVTEQKSRKIETKSKRQCMEHNNNLQSIGKFPMEIPYIIMRTHSESNSYIRYIIRYIRYINDKTRNSQYVWNEHNHD